MLFVEKEFAYSYKYFLLPSQKVPEALAFPTKYGMLLGSDCHLPLHFYCLECFREMFWNTMSSLASNSTLIPTVKKYIIIKSLLSA